MAQYIRSINALDPTENISYRKGRVIRADYAENRLDVVCGDETFRRLPVFYHCTGSENTDAYGSVSGGSLAFALEDEVLVRFYKGDADMVCGFYDKIWPCIPMPAMALATEEKIYARSLFQETDYTETARTLFEKRYAAITEKTCSVSLTTVSNAPLPADYHNRFIAVVTSGFDGTYYYRNTTVYFNGTPVYTTANYETTGSVFNGTRSNIIAAFVHPVTNEGILVYQVNRFTDWVPKTSGRVDFSFHIYFSSGRHEETASGYSVVTGGISEASGTGITDAQGFYTDTADTGYAFCMNVTVENMMNFSAASGEQKPAYSNKSHSLVYTLFYGSDGGEINTARLEYDEWERLLMPDGEYGYAEIHFYKKK